MVKQAATKEVFVFPASFAQQRLWFFEQLHPGRALYHITETLGCKGALHAAALQEALNAVAARHEALRTSFAEEAGAPVQLIAAEINVPLPLTDINSLPEPARAAEALRWAQTEAARPFDLTRGPLVRAGLLRLTEDEHLLQVTLHHLISDGWSMEIFFRELALCYQAALQGAAPSLPELPIQYADYTQWQREHLQGETLAAQLAWWKQQFATLPPALALPTDHPRPATQNLRGARALLTLPTELTAALKQLSQQEGATLFMTMLAAFQTLLYRYTGQDDFSLGLPVAGRALAETEGVIGLFVNTLPLRADLSGAPTFRQLLQRVRDNTLAALAQQDLPLEKLVEALQPERNMQRTALFQTMFIYDSDKLRLELPGLRVSTLDLDYGAIRTDLDLYVTETDEGLRCAFMYDAELFEAATIERMGQRLQALLEDVVSKPDATLHELASGKLQFAVAPVAGRLPEQRQTEVRRTALSSHQERLWFIDQFETGNVYESSPTYHNLPLVLHLHGALDPALLETCLKTIINRHAALRTLIQTEEGRGWQIVSPQAEIKLKTVAAYDSAPDLQTLVNAEAQQPFNLETELPVRAALYQLSNNEAVLIVTIHHISADRQSLRLIAAELAELYDAHSSARAPRLPEPALQYANYSEWQNSLTKAEWEPLLFYWRWQLRGGVRALELPEDRPRPAVHTYTAAQLPFAVARAVEPAPLPQAHNDENGAGSTARATTAASFTTALTAFKVLLHRYAQQNEIVVGVSDYGREPETARTIGPLANLLVLRSDLSGNPTFRALLEQITNTVAQARTHRALPFDKLVQELNPEKDMSRTALFDVLFQYDEEPTALQFGDLAAQVLETGLGAGKYDLNLSLRRNNGALTGTLVYNADIYDESTMRQLLRHYAVVLEALQRDPQQRIDDFSLLSQDEERQQLSGCNATQAAWPQDKTIHQLFVEQAARTPDNIAVVCGDVQLTYRKLDEQSNQLAHYLRQRGVTPETLVALCLDRSTEMIVALLAVLKAGGAYLPLDPAYPEERLRFMLEDSGTAYLITTKKLADKIPQPLADTILLDKERTTIAAQPTTTVIDNTAPQQLAYCLYTSGSTGKPKGVLLEHRNVVRLLFNDKLQFDFTSADVWTMFHSYCFDFSVWEMYGALLYGGKLIVVPEQVRHDPAAFLDLLLREQVTVLNQTPTAFHNLAQLISSPPPDKGMKTKEYSAGNPETIPLSSFPCRVAAEALTLRYVIFGGEALHPLQLREWRARYPGVKLINMYGITETTVHVTFKEITEQEIAANLSNIGGPIPTTTTYVLDERQRLLPVGVPGELCVGGAGVGRGYLKRDELTRQRFIANPYRPAERLYRSGDRAKLLANGELIYLGRFDDQVQIRGFRVELGEIKNRLLEHPLVSKVEVIAHPGRAGALELAAYVVPAAEVSVTALRAHVAQTLPHYMTPAHFVLLNALPLTSNGKVDKRRLPPPDEARPELQEAYLAPRTPAEEKLAQIWAEVLGVARVGARDNFFELGGHSLLATQMIARVRAAFQTALPMRVLFEAPTVAGLAENIAQQSGVQTAPQSISRRNDKGAAPLSFAQEQLWFTDRLTPGTHLYNIVHALRLQGPLNVAALEGSLAALIERHEVLRTAFAETDGQPQLVIAPRADFTLPLTDLSKLAESAQAAEMEHCITAEVQYVFDLRRSPLLRAVLLRLNTTEHVLLLNIHHIAFDGWSMGVFMRELAALYAAFAQGQPSPLPELPLQYSDFAAWQRAWAASTEFAEQLAYWRRQLAGAPAVLELPVDKPRADARSFRGVHEKAWLSTVLTEELQTLCRQEGVTLFMLLLAAWQLLLAYLSGQQDIVVGTDIANRNRVETEGLLGLFVNHAALRTNLSGDPTLRELLARVRETALGAYAHQDAPFSQVVAALKPERALKHTPLFQALFVLQNTLTPVRRLHDVTMTPLAFDNQTTKYDLSLFIEESDAGLLCYWVYRTDLFHAETIKHLTAQFATLLQGVVAQPGAHLGALLTPLQEADAQRRRERAKTLAEVGLAKLKNVKRKAVRAEET